VVKLLLLFLAKSFESGIAAQRDRDTGAQGRFQRLV